MAINIEEAGNPRRKTQTSTDSNGEQASSTGNSSNSRRKRISVTPKDPDKLEEVAEELGLPQSKVYNMGFQALLDKFGLE